MPFKDPEKRKAAQRDSKRRSRAEIESGGKVEIQAEPPDSISSTAQGNDQGLDQKSDKSKSAPLGKKPSVKYYSQEEMIKLGHELKEARHSTAYQVAKRSRELLSGQDYVLWKCTRLKDELICIIRDDQVEKYPENFPVFTVDEISTMHQGNKSLETWQFVIDTKKVCGKVLVEA